METDTNSSYQKAEKVQLSLEDYYIGWICALPSELAASKAMLDEVHDMIHAKDLRDSNTYVLGRVHSHNVVIASLPAGIDGTNAASTTAANLLRTFKSVRVGLMVGIGGGIPNLQRGIDIRLGDVVVSQPSGRSGGIIQYDKGKKLENGHFEHKGQLNSPPTVLLTALANLQGDHMMVGSRMPSYLESLTQKYPRMGELGFGSPDGLLDILRCTMDHQGTNECQYCDNGETRRTFRQRKEPRIHYGIIVSINQVIKSTTDRDLIREQTGAICVEMEAAGLMNDFPCLVVRGIVDYADGSKNDTWHNYASATAAAFAKELLLYVSVKDAGAEQPLGKAIDILKTQHKDILKYHQLQDQHNRKQSSFHQQQETRFENETLRMIHRDLYTSIYTDHKDINRNPAPDTCRWVLDHPNYLRWLNSSYNELLWVSADPGCGKSVLSKHLVDYCLRDTDKSYADTSVSLQTIPHSVCYFFFKDNPTQDNLATAFCAILHQLFTRQPTLISFAKRSFDKKGDILRKDPNEMWSILQNAARSPEAEPITCIFDGIDECRDNDRQRLLKLLCSFHFESRSMLSDRRHWLKFLVTSRPYHDIEDGLHASLQFLPLVRIRGEDTCDELRREIDIVIDQSVQGLARRRNLSDNTTKRIRDKLVAAENRTYLWLYLILDDIEDTLHNSLRPDDESFSALPQSVEQVYEKILKRGVTEKNRTMVKAIFTIITGAERALTLGEMAIALDIATDSRPKGCIKDFSINAHQLAKNIRHWCGLFVTVKHEKLYFLHQTVKEFLLSPENIVTPLLNKGDIWKHCLSHTEVERVMASILVTFLCLKDFETRLEEVKLHEPIWWHNHSSTDHLIQQLRYATPQSILERYMGLSPASSVTSFHDFAAQHWIQHVQRAGRAIDDAMSKDRIRLYDPSRAQFPFLVAKYLRLPRVMKRTINKGTSIQTFRLKDPDSITNGVQFAAFNNDIEVLRRLLKQVPDLKDVPNRQKETPMYLAIERGHFDAMTTLLDAGADPNIRLNFNWTALMKAAELGHASMVQALLQFGSRVEDMDNLNRSALYIASVEGHDEVVHMLLAAGSLTDAADKDGNTPLMRACEGGHKKCVEVLLEARADVNTVGGDGTPLILAATWGRENLIRMLLEAGVDINLRCQYRKSTGRSTMRWGDAVDAAREAGYPKIVQILPNAKEDR